MAERSAEEQKALPESPLGKVIGYLGAMRKGLLVFLSDPEVDIESNDGRARSAGCLARPESHFGSRSVGGTEVAAIPYSLVESPRAKGPRT